ncbi:transmembrane protein 208-like protein [Trifolium pratense]|uniref:Transmembrane protein 208-like protein n=1 Tax=Trifolium pratense TaxID=57577 RepID=A0A2K3NSF8_TRIPR|nr:transmembrane protein 208-like protein [Trifolium pratense]
MANQGAKKRKEENTRHMARIRRIIIACNVIYVVIRMLIFHSSFTWKHWIGLVVTSLAYYFPYQQLAKMANPSYADDGELLDGGFDMTTGGVCGYLHDVIYITSFVQVASIISGKFWYIYLVSHTWTDTTSKNVVLASIGSLPAKLGSVHTCTQLFCSKNIPAFGAYQSFGLIKGFLPQGGSEEVEDEKTRKKREKLEKKASRPKFVKTRTR